MGLDQILTHKQKQVLHSYLHDDWKIMILSGAFRAGKTVMNNYIFVMELKRIAKLAKSRKDPHPQYILAGYSSNSIYTNVISAIESYFGITMKTDRHGHYHLFGVDIVPSYTGSIRGVGSIRGMTSYGAYINEASLATHDVFQEILQRCSIEGARIICDTNPDIPTHWLKTDYIDNPDPKARIKSFTFTIDDNTFLSKDYVESIKAATPKGMFYDRGILGQWVTGDGIVYRDFDKDKMVISREQVPDDLEYYVGVDWGYEHPNPIILLGDDKDGNTYVLADYTKKHKFIDYWVRIAKNLQASFGRNLIFYADSARPDNVSEFQANGINCINANKNIMPGIECVARKMRIGQFYVVDTAASGLLEEIYQYAWDDKTGLPLKENDVRHNDRLDAIRYAIYSRNKKGGFVPWN
ncbi:PBSX family phage terminase large subunit [Lactobacillus gasseri]|jgi:PBSX family phage terminase large subunit|uniref:PBSX family phage terminase large subunit n=1 Tax=Lactobacillus gasseri TaxID=1596 RepID=UPI0007643D6B|nr:PBSX family phage terminase large subunit [Lactobacillus gasseri]DAX25156.1 MAG TPA: large terminase [Bacteriophage sp.]KXA25052.1 phage terminase, large subunit, PBSX family [Lactobacillus gasseri]MCZ3484209.1 PBSX family phage terminase large subunit [Lactobacillus gasseri]MCZ3484944.1 PBSX family phage terminase large subunit [Lactobacillus gasseri]MCZ3492880.1 PBSX family phage terminase large subunit [Lactobacillus gasseri]